MSMAEVLTVVQNQEAELKLVRAANARLLETNRVLRNDAYMLTAQRDGQEAKTELSKHTFSDSVLAEHAVEVDSLWTKFEMLRGQIHSYESKNAMREQERSEGMLQCKEEASDV